MTNQTNINEPLGKLRAIESQLCTLLVEREEVVRTALLALLCKENLVVVGPPLVFPHQLFRSHPALHASLPVYLVEEWLFFRQYRFHQQKLLFHRASMQYYRDFLQQSGYVVL